MSSGRIINMCLGGVYSNIEVEEEVRTGFTLKHTIVVESETAKKLKLG